MKLPVVYPQKLCKAVLKLGFVEERQVGSHKTFIHSDGRKITIPFHSNKPIPAGLLNKMLKQDLNISRYELVKLL